MATEANKKPHEYAGRREGPGGSNLFGSARCSCGWESAVIVSTECVALWIVHVAQALIADLLQRS